MERKKQVFLCVLAIVSIVAMIPNLTRGDIKEKEEFSGIPDVVDSTIIDNNYYLTVVANRTVIESEEEFAREIIHMCQNNSFHSTKFSTDIHLPTGLDITVYLNDKDIEKRNEPICKIEFKTDNFNID